MKKKFVTLFSCLPFVLSAFIPAAAQEAQAVHAGQKDRDTQSVAVEITEQGYQPESLKLKRDVPARITFTRRTDKTCVREIMIQEYDIKRGLPLDQPVVVEFTPRKSGEFTFACGMNMLRGKLIVR